MPQTHKRPAGGRTALSPSPRASHGRARKPKAASVLLVFNPNANCLLPYAKAAGKSPSNYLRELLDGLGLDAELMMLDKHALRTLPKRLAQNPPDAVWVAGGDGSVLALAGLTRKLDIPLGVIPAGTMNLLARDLGMSLDLSQALTQLSQAEVTAIDIGEVNGHSFLCLSNLGLSTRFSKMREERRHLSAIRRWPAIAFHMIKSLFDYPALRYEITANGRTWRVRTRSISISDNPLSNERNLLPARPQLDQGKLAIYVTREKSVWSLPRLYSRLMLGKWQKDPEMQVIEASEAVLRVPKRRKIRVMLDGELLQLSTPLHYRIYPQALKVLRPVPELPAEATHNQDDEACSLQQPLPGQGEAS